MVHKGIGKNLDKILFGRAPPEIHSIYANDFLYGRFISISASKLAGKSAGKEKERVLQQFAGKKESEQRDTIVSVTIRRSIIYSRKKRPHPLGAFNNRLMVSVPKK